MYVLTVVCLPHGPAHPHKKPINSLQLKDNFSNVPSITSLAYSPDIPFQTRLITQFLHHQHIIAHSRSRSFVHVC